MVRNILERINVSLVSIDCNLGEILSSFCGVGVMDDDDDVDDIERTGVVVDGVVVMEEVLLLFWW